MRIIEIKEDLKIEQGDHNVVLEKGDVVVVNLLNENDFSPSKFSVDNITEFFTNSGLKGNMMTGYRLQSRREKLIYDVLPTFKSLDIYSPYEDLYCSFDYKTIDRLLLDREGFAIVDKLGRLLFRVHL